MRKGAFSKKMLSVLLAGSMVVGSASDVVLKRKTASLN